MLKHVLRGPVGVLFREAGGMAVPALAGLRRRPTGTPRGVSLVDSPVVQQTTFLLNFLFHDRLTAEPWQLRTPKGLLLGVKCHW